MCLNMKNEKVLENKESFSYALKHIKTERVDNILSLGSHSDELKENDKLSSFRSKKNIIRKEIESKN